MTYQTVGHLLSTSPCGPLPAPCRGEVHAKGSSGDASKRAPLDKYRSQFPARVHHSKAMADLLPNGFIWALFCPDLDQSILEVSQARQMSVCHISSSAFGSTGVGRERISEYRKCVWIDGRRARAHFNTPETHLDRRAPRFGVFPTVPKCIWVGRRRARPNLNASEAKFNVWIDRRPARANFNTPETHLDRRAPRF